MVAGTMADMSSASPQAGPSQDFRYSHIAICWRNRRQPGVNGAGRFFSEKKPKKNQKACPLFRADFDF
jgi:hypothetical protein